MEEQVISTGITFGSFLVLFFVWILLGIAFIFGMTLGRFIFRGEQFNFQGSRDRMINLLIAPFKKRKAKLSPINTDN